MVSLKEIVISNRRHFKNIELCNFETLKS